MATYTFQPPNCQSFSDEVISVVVPRPSPPRSRIQDPSPPSLNPILLNSRSTPAAPAISAALRERRRLNQARYRHRQRGLIQRLEEESAQLQEEIERLGAWRQKKLIDAPTYKSLWNIASEYFHLFQRALRPLPAAEHVHGLSFLESVMVPDVISASGSGMYALLDNWVLVSHFFEDIHVDLERMDKASVVATTTTSVTISANALRRAFPHLVNEAEQGESWPRFPSNCWVSVSSCVGRCTFSGMTRRPESRSSKANRTCFHQFSTFWET